MMYEIWDLEFPDPVDDKKKRFVDGLHKEVIFVWHDVAATSPARLPFQIIFWTRVFFHHQQS